MQKYSYILKHNYVHHQRCLDSIYLNNLNCIFLFSKRNTFERGQSDVFRIRSVSVGILKKLRIEIDNQGYAPAWFLERVIFFAEFALLSGIKIFGI